MNLKQQLILCDKALSNNNFIEAKTLLEEVIKIYPNIFELNFKYLKKIILSLLDYYFLVIF